MNNMTVCGAEQPRRFQDYPYDRTLNFKGSVDKCADQTGWKRIACILRNTAISLRSWMKFDALLCVLSSRIFSVFFPSNQKKGGFRNSIIVSNRMNPDQVRRFVGTDLG